jgi:RNA polymerase sigma factor (sigma-70 family)
MEALSDQAQRALTEMAWVRQLARALLRDDAAADDIAQDAYVIAAAKAPADRPLRPWLGRVVLNLVRMRARGAKRSDARESVVAEAAAPAGTPEELVARVEIQRVVAGEVLALREPYRTTILLHFVEGLTSAEIAQKLDVPDGTVRRRLKVALDELRQRLEGRDDAPRGGWLAALVPFAALPRRADAAPSPATAASSSAVLGIAIALVALVTVVLVIVLVARRDEPVARQSSAARPRIAIGLPSPAAPATNVPGWLVQEGAPPRRVAGTVTASGTPVPFATVRLAVVVSPLQTLLLAERATQFDGTFDFGEQPAASYVVSAQAPERTPSSIAVDVANPNSHPDAISIDLDPCVARLVGTVRDASGGVVAGARLSVAGQADTLADDAGTYSLCLPGGERVRVDADGYGSRDVGTYSLGGVVRFDIVLVPESIIIGRVLDGGARPVAGAHVTVTPEGVRNQFGLTANIAETDSDGRFRVDGVGPGKHRVDAMFRDLMTPTPTVVFARPGMQSTELVLALASRRHVTGTVRSSSKPAAGARIMLIDPQQRPQMDTEPGPTAVSQLDGSFTLESLPGTFDVLATPFDVLQPTRITVGDADVTVELEVSPRATIRGRAVSHGVPVANAEVVRMSDGPAAATRSDRDGTFVFEGVPPGRTRIIAQSLAHKRFGAREVQVIGNQDLGNIDVELPWAGEVIGRVVDAKGAPVPDAQVSLMGPDGDFASCPTDAGGEFECVGLSGGGDYVATVHPTVALQHAFMRADGGAPPKIHVTDGETIVRGVELAIRHERRSISGRIVDDEGAPVADCNVLTSGDRAPQPLPSLNGTGFGPPMTMSARDGRFEIGDLAPGLYNSFVTCPDNSTAEQTGITAGDHAVEIRLHRAGRITGRLVGFSARPAVHTYRFTPTTQAGFMAVVTGDTFTFDGVPPGTYPIEAIAGLQTDAQLVEVKPGGTVTLELRARPTAPITGRVFERGTNAPVPGIMCQARALAGGFHGDLVPIGQSEPTDAQGRFSLVAPTGRVRIVCLPPPGPISVGGTDVELPSMLPVDVAVVRWPPRAANVGFMMRPMFLPLTVLGLEPGGPAVTSGMQPGDVLIAVDGKPLTGLIPMSALAVLAGSPVGVPLRLTVERGAATRVIELVPAAFPPQP